ncbi:SDR family NAD(P)-dependent oxidoreductase, partial [Paenibacillus sp. TH7-28]
MNGSNLDYILEEVVRKRMHAEEAARLLLNAAVEQGPADQIGMENGAGSLNPEDIAVIGLACNFPGSSSVEQFWNNLSSGKDSITEIPADRWPLDEFYDPSRRTPNTSYSKWGGFIENIDQFDAAFFGISHSEAKLMDPQQRLFLQLAHETFERAGYPKSKIENTRTGVFVGTRAGTYEVFGKTVPSKDMATANMANLIPGRISDFFNLRGPSLSVDTACSSSLVAVHYACQSIRSGDCDMALAGGCELKLKPFPYYILSLSGALSEDGKCRTFDRKADGFVAGEGLGAVLLKQLGAALRDGDNIYGVIKGSAVNNDGRTMGITSPNLQGQKDVLEQALRQSGIHPEQVGYVEAHGTGTVIGDPIEFKALEQTYRMHTGKRGYCALGSVKTNIGHLDTAAGIASLIKVLLCLRHRRLPPSLHCDEPNPRLQLLDSPFYIPSRLEEWESQDNQPRTAGISSFGFGGTNCHLIVCEAPVRVRREAFHYLGSQMLAISAATEKGLQSLVHAYGMALEHADEETFHQICHWALEGRDVYRHRLSVQWNRSAGELARLLKSLKPWSSEANGQEVLRYGSCGRRNKAPVFLFTGQGAQYSGMGKVFYQTEPCFKAVVDRCSELAIPYLQRSLKDYLLRSDIPALELQDTVVTQMITFTLDYALARLWMEWGIRPGAVIGHSVGEYPAACLSGMFTLEEGIRLIGNRGLLMHKLERKGIMAVVFAPQNRVKEALENLPRERRVLLGIAAVNGINNTVVSGEESAVVQWLNLLEAAGFEHRRLPVSHAFHSPLMNSVLQDFVPVLTSVSFNETKIPFYSTLQAAEISRTDSNYWISHITEPVRFMETAQLLLEEGKDVFLEVGPSKTLAQLVQNLGGPREIVSVSTLQQGIPVWRAVNEARAELYRAGFAAKAPTLYKTMADPAAIEQLPTYPFESVRHWIEQSRPSSEGHSTVKNHSTAESEVYPMTDPHPLLDGFTFLSDTKRIYYRTFCENEVYFKDHIVRNAPVIAGTIWIEAVSAAVHDFAGLSQLLFEDLHFLEPLYLKEEKERRAEIILEKIGDGFRFEVQSLSLRSVGEEVKVHARGMVNTAVQLKEHQTDLALLAGRCSRTLKGEELYRLYSEKIGIRHGPFFRGVKEVKTNPGEMEVVASLDLKDDGARKTFRIHPGLLDSAMQGIAALEVGPDDRIEQPHSFIPFYFSKVAVLGSVQGACTANCKVTKSNNEITKFDLTLTGGDGTPLVLIRDAYAKKVPHSDFAAALSDREDSQFKLDEIVFYKRVWRECPIRELNPGPPVREGLCLLFRLEDEYHERIEHRLRENGLRIITVCPGTEYAKLNDGTYSVRPGSCEDMRSLKEGLIEPVGSVIHMWTLDEGVSGQTPVAADSRNAWEHGLTLGVYALLPIAKEIMSGSNGRAKELRVLTNGAFPVAGRATIPWKSAMTGFILSAKAEMPGAQFSVLDIAVPSTAEMLLMKEMAGGSNEPLVTYDGSKRIVPAMKEITPELSEQRPAPLKRGGVYVITGGLGGIGSLLAERLSIKYGARIALIGRTPVDLSGHERGTAKSEPGIEDKKDKLLRLRGINPELVYYTADITDRKQLSDVLDQIKNRFGPIDGVFHLAGHIRDSFIATKSAESFRQVMSSKIWGAYNLDLLTKQEPLKCFVLFSSLSSIAGTASQSDYAAANAFVDGFAWWRSEQSTGLTMSVNWGLWEETGMSADTKVIQNAIRQGVAVISGNKGLDALEKAVAAGEVQIVADLRRNKDIYAFGDSGPGHSQDKPEQEPNMEFADAGKGAADPRAQIDLETWVRKHMEKRVQAATGFREWTDDDREPTFLELGMDSVSLVSLVHELEREFTINLYPTVFFEYQTISEFAAYLTGEYGERLEAYRSGQGTQQGKHSKEGGPKRTGQDTYSTSNIRREESGIAYLETAPEILHDDADNTGKKVSHMGGVAAREILLSESPTGVPASVRSEDIAIIGYSLRFPDADSGEEYWSNLISGNMSLTEMASPRFDKARYYGEVPGNPGKTYCTRGGFLKQMDRFDPAFFNISPREAALMDPKQRLFLEVSWEAFEHAGYGGNLPDRKVGVFVGTSYNNYFAGLPSEEGESAFGSLGNGNTVTANRVSHFMNLNGPSMIVDTYCSSSLAALHLACQSLKNGECRMALAGGVHVLGIRHYIMMSQVQALSPSGICRTFDRSADGYVPGEGAGALLLKPLRQALKDQDTIHAVIKGTAVNHDGRSNNLTAPNASEQANVIREAFSNAGVHPETVTYVEAHGTGTSLGDPIEVKGLTRGFETFTGRKNYCAIGSVKSNIGHLEPASGMAGIIKVILAMKHKQLPPTLNFNCPNPYIDFSDTPFYVNDRTSEWYTVGAPRRAGISSFGLTGTNAHVILEEAPINPGTVKKEEARLPFILTISGKNRHALNELADRYSGAVDRHKEWRLEDICRTAGEGRRHFPCRISIEADSIEGLADKLKLATLLEDRSKLAPSGIFRSEGAEKRRNVIVLGNEADHGDARGRDVLRDHPAFLRHRETVLQAAAPYISLNNDDAGLCTAVPLEAGSGIGRDLSLLAFQYAMVMTLQDWGMKPGLYIGQGVGEWSAAVLSGMLRLEDAVTLLAHRRTFGQGLMDFEKQMKELLATVSVASPLVPVVSSLDGTIMDSATVASSDYWEKENRQFDLWECIGRHVTEEQDIVLHLGGKCGGNSQSLQRYLALSEGAAFHSLCKAAAVLYASGTHIDWTKYYEFLPSAYNKLELPTYAFQRSSYWMQDEQEKKMDALPQLAADARGFRELAVIRPEASSTKAEETENTFGQTHIYHPVWELSGMSLDAPGWSSFPEQRVWLLLGDSSSCCEELASLLKEMGQRVVMAEPASAFTSVEKDVYTLDPGLEEHWEALVDQLSSQYGNVHAIIHMWDRVAETDSERLEVSRKEWTKGVYSLFLLEKALERAASGNRTAIYAVTHGAFPVSPADHSVRPAQASVAALLKTIRSETGKVCRCVDFADHAVEERGTASLILQELMAKQEKVPVVAYRDKRRYVQRLARLTPAEHLVSPIPEQGGVYLIVGGASGIGLKIAAHLSRGNGVKIILTGRTSIPPKEAWHSYAMEHEEDDPVACRIRDLTALESAGAEVVYFDADVTNETKLAFIANYIRKHYGTLDGIVHSGGLKRDALVKNKQFSEFKKIFETKAVGYSLLDTVFRGLKPKWIAGFSSLSAWFGNPGQTDYAAGNAFMDAYAQEKANSGETRYFTIGWSYWREGGMEASAGMLKQMSSAGMLPLESEEALNVFESCLFADVPSSVYVINEASAEKIATDDPAVTYKLGGNEPELVRGREAQFGEEAQARSLASNSQNNGQSEIEDFIRQVLKELLLLQDHEMSEERTFEEMGMDSLILQRFIERLERRLGSPAEISWLYDYPTVPALAHELAKSWPAEKATELVEKAEPAPQAETKVTVPYFNLTSREASRSFTDSPAVLAAEESATAAGSIPERLAEANRTATEPIEGAAGEDIAVIGLACRFPQADSPDEFWQLLKNGIHAVRMVPDERTELELLQGTKPEATFGRYSSKGGFVRHIDRFDAALFGFSEAEAAALDPQHRILLETAWTAFESSGYSKSSLWGQPVGVFVGARGGTYKAAAAAGTDGYASMRAAVTGRLANFNAARISDFFNLKGPSLVFDTACSSSLVSVHYACKALRDGECGMALAGGAEIKSSAEFLEGLSATKALSPDGTCHVFDKRANGFVPGEGVGAVLLKPYRRALADGDTVYAVIKGSAVNNDGHTMGITTPDLEGQAAVIERALEEAGVHPETVTYVEAHGTGTMIGDPIEVKALTRVFAKRTDRKAFCGLGSVKANIGHLDTAAGIASLIKVVLALHHGQLPPVLHLNEPNPRFRFVDSPFYPNGSLQEWAGADGVRRAGISSFGFGGTNCHMIVEGAPARELHEG